jgi:hypothetical protein
MFWGVGELGRGNLLFGTGREITLVKALSSRGLKV